MKKQLRWYATLVSLLFLPGFSLGEVSSALAAPVPGGTLDPTTIPKYVTPLVIPPEMPKSTASPAPAADYDIAVRQFKQQILPGGIWGGSFPATTVWSYGRAEDPLPDSSTLGGAVGVAPAPNSTFNYPAFTVENTSMSLTNVRWINDLVDKDPLSPNFGNYLPHLFTVDQSLHWANPPMANCNAMTMGGPNQTDCHTDIPTPYTGPVPLVTHVHGSHVQPESDGYPQSWWLPGAPGTKGIPASYAERGSDFTQANNLNTIPGSAYYGYENTQPATTLWYHDHALGMTRLNVYAGPAGFWLIRGGANGDALVDDFSTGTAADGTLPGPAPSTTAGDPNFDPAVRSTIREVPIAIQDRSFNTDGSLFYPTERSFFDGFTGPYIGGVDPPVGPSDIAGIWNPEAFFNTMVVNGTTWPRFEVAQARYRLRLLNGCNSRTLNLALFVVSSLGADGLAGTNDDLLDPLLEIPFYQIGAEQGFLPKVVKITTGFATPLPGNGTLPAAMTAADASEALLMGPAERADVIVDFSALANNTRIRMINTAPDAPFGKLPDDKADPLTTGQVMDFIVNTTLNLPSDETTTLPENLLLPAEAPLGPVTNTRQLSLNELSSNQICVEIDHDTEEIVGTLFSVAPSDPGYATFLADCQAATPVNPENNTEPMGPRQALLGVMTKDGQGNLTGSTPLMWSDPITETPLLNDTEVWEIFNTTVDAHPIHLHLVRFEVLDRQKFDEDTLKPVAGTLTSARPNEAGYKDTVLAYPGQITRVKAKFDIAGLYVWHCHIVEHEDNEMMRPYIVAAATTLTLKTGWNLVSSTIAIPAATFGAGSKFASLWKWGGKNWAVYLPGETSTGAYATSKGFDQLSTIDPGEGFWVDVNSAGGETVTLTGTPVSGQLSFAKGWNLKGLMSATPLTVAEISMDQPALNSIWKWENDNWSVYLAGEASPGAYANAHGFGQLTTINPGEGFWVHRP